MPYEEDRPVNDEAASEEFGGSARQVNTGSQFIATSPDTLVQRATRNYLSSIEHEMDVDFERIRDHLLDRINGEIELENRGRRAAHSSSERLLKINALDEITIVRVLLARRRIVNVDLTEGAVDDMTQLAMYCKDGADAGTYSRAEAPLKRLVSELRGSFTARAIDSVLLRLRSEAPVVSRTKRKHLIPVRNGVFDHDAQVLRPHSPDWVFLSKIPVDYDAAAPSPSIVMPDGQEWTFDGWIESLSNDDGVPALLWEVVSAAVRSDSPWHKSAWLVSERGNNGKGTFVAFLRNLLGAKACASIPLSNFGRDFWSRLSKHA